MEAHERKGRHQSPSELDVPAPAPGHCAAPPDPAAPGRPRWPVPRGRLFSASAMAPLPVPRSATSALATREGPSSSSSPHSTSISVSGRGTSTAGSTRSVRPEFALADDVGERLIGAAPFAVGARPPPRPSSAADHAPAARRDSRARDASNISASGAAGPGVRSGQCLRTVCDRCPFQRRQLLGRVLRDAARR